MMQKFWQSVFPTWQPGKMAGEILEPTNTSSTGWVTAFTGLVESEMIAYLPTILSGSHLHLQRCYSVPENISLKLHELAADGKTTELAKVYGKICFSNI